MIGFYNYTVILTYLGFASGVIGIICSISHKLFWAIFCLMLSGLCDCFDGRIARTMERTTDEKRFGVQIDSLSDLVCFGVLPGMIGYGLGMRTIPHIAIIVLYILAGLIRLAYFNVLEEQPKTEGPKLYHGLPITSAALIFPVFYAMKVITRHSVAVYTATMIFVGSAFVTDFTFKKPGLRGILIMLGIGVVEIIFVILAIRGII